MLHLLRSIFGRKASSIRHGKRPAASAKARLTLESLEDRCVPTVGFSLSGTTLTVTGDQSQVNQNDTVTISSDPYGTTTVNLNGQTQSYGHGQVSQINVNLGGGSDTAYVVGSWCPVSISGTGSDMVKVGSGQIAGKASLLSTIEGSVSISNPNGTTELEVGDDADLARSISMGANSISIPNVQFPSFNGGVSSTNGTVSVSWSGVDYLSFAAGSGSTVSVSDTIHRGDTDLYPGMNSTVNVMATSQPLSVYTFSSTVNVTGCSSAVSINNTIGFNSVAVGNGSVGGIHGPISITSNGETSLSVDDHSDGIPQTISLDANSLSFASGPSVTWSDPSFPSAVLTGLSLTTGPGYNTINVHATSEPVSLTGEGFDTTVNVGQNGSVQGIAGALNIQPPPYTTINVDDSADAVARSVTVGNATTSGFGIIHGLAPADISFKYADTAQLTVSTGTGGNTVNVQATGVATNLIDHGYGTVNVGNNGSVQGILGALNITNPPSYTTINVNDSADATARSVTVGNATTSGFGVIHGLAPADIDFKYGDTAQITVSTGTGGNTVNVLATGVATNLIGHGRDTVNVGQNGSVQGILGALNIQNPPSFTTINVDDSADAVSRTVTVGNSATSGFGVIHGLAPADINFKYADTAQLTVSTGTGGNIIDVLATGVATNLIGHGRDTVNIGNNGSVQGILGALNISNPPSYTAINVDDSADTAARTATLSETTINDLLWESLSGLSPAAINYHVGDVSSIAMLINSSSSVAVQQDAGIFTTVNGQLR